MTFAAPIVAIIASVIALAIAANNAKRSKRLDSKILAQQESTEQQFLELQAKLDACTERLAARTAEDMNLFQQKLISIDQQQAHRQKEVDHLRSEAQNLAMLPIWHPTREWRSLPNCDRVWRRLLINFPSLVSQPNRNRRIRLDVSDARSQIPILVDFRGGNADPLLDRCQWTEERIRDCDRIWVQQLLHSDGVRKDWGPFDQR